MFKNLKINEYEIDLDKKIVENNYKEFVKLTVENDKIQNWL